MCGVHLGEHYCGEARRGAQLAQHVAGGVEPHAGPVVRLDAAGDVLRELCAAPGLAAVVLTEVNPTHDPAGTQTARYVETVTHALALALS